MKFDIIGRIQNMRLPDGKTAILYSVYEAVSNSIHSIVDRFGEARAAKNGLVEIDIVLEDDGDVKSIAITDNGVGFTDENIISFETSDSQFKYKKGGKGVGRLIWIKMFETIRIDSVIARGRKKERVRFRFAPEKENSIAYKNVSPAPDSELLTTVTLSDLRQEQKGRVRLTSYLKELALHFFPQYVSGTLPNVVVNYGGTIASLNEFIDGKVSVPQEQDVQLEIDVTRHNLHISHLFVDSSISTNLRNSYLLTAHGRLVGDPISIELKYSLKELPEGKAYVAVVSSDFLDQRVDQERLDFKLTRQQRSIIEESILSEIEKFLSDHIGKLRDHQRLTVDSLLYEHPQLATQITNVDDYVSGLSPGMDDEQIAQNLFVLLYRDERELRRRIERYDHLETLDAEVREQAEETLEELQNQEKHRLAELVVKRHQVLQLANVLLKYDDAEKESYRYERVIHDLICPMGEMYRGGEHTRHNLWVIDDNLANYEFFASDKSITSLADTSASRKEPDVIFFNPLGFRRAGTDDPVVIIEFKRPGDTKPSQNPVEQVLNYTDELRNATIRDIDGGTVMDISDKTPFECIILCELTKQTRKLLETSIAQHRTPDNQGYYGYSPVHNAYIRVISFSKMLRDAEVRNQAYFDQLNLGSPSVAAKRRAAKTRQRQAAARLALPHAVSQPQG